MSRAIPIDKHKERGTYQPCRHEGKLSPKPGDVGACPRWFSRVSREEWRRITKDPVYSQVLAACHRGAMVEYCHLYGLMIADAKGEAVISSSQRQTLNSLRMQLGLTPASAAKVPAPVATPENKWAKFAK